MANLLITGGAGFIGGNFVHYWSEKYPEDQLIVLDALTYAGHRTTLERAARTTLIEGDIRDEALVERILREHDVMTVVHFAAESHVDRSISGPDAFIDTNILGTYSILKAVSSVWLSGSGAPHRFHHISTDEVFGCLESDEPAFSESTRYAPNSPYAASKAGSDHLVRAFHRTYGLDVTTTNCSNNYGPYQHPEKLIPLMVINAIHGLPLPVYGDGMNERDWLHVEDHCRGIEASLMRGKAGETYNIGSGAGLANLEVIAMVCEEVDRAFCEDECLAQRFPNAPPVRGEASNKLKTLVTDRAGHDWRYAVDGSKARAELGFVPRRTLREGLRETVRWYLENESWWKPLLGSHLELAGRL